MRPKWSARMSAISKLSVCSFLILFLLPHPSAANAEDVRLIVVKQHSGPVLTIRNDGAAGNKYGFEGGRVVKVGKTYHLFTSEMAGDPHWVKMRLAHWTSTDRVHWKRLATLLRVERRFHGQRSARGAVVADACLRPEPSAGICFTSRTKRRPTRFTSGSLTMRGASGAPSPKHPDGTASTARIGTLESSSSAGKIRTRGRVCRERIRSFLIAPAASGTRFTAAHTRRACPSRFGRWAWRRRHRWAGRGAVARTSTRCAWSRALLRIPL